MKKLLMALFLLMPIMTRADKETVNGIEWNYIVKGEGAEIGEGKEGRGAVSGSVEGDIVIPRRLGGYPVTSIRSYAFWRRRRINSVIIHQDVSNIESRAFAGCTGLTSIVVHEANPYYRSSDGMLCSKDGAILFRGINDKGNAVIPSGVQNIAEFAFDGCIQLNL